MRKLADEIIESQRKEVAEMKYLLRAVEREGVQAARKPESQAEHASIGDAVRSADLATTDLEPITDAELQQMLGSGSSAASPAPRMRRRSRSQPGLLPAPARV